MIPFAEGFDQATGQVTDQATDQASDQASDQVDKLLQFCTIPHSVKEIMQHLGKTIFNHPTPSNVILSSSQRLTSRMNELHLQDKFLIPFFKVNLTHHL